MEHNLGSISSALSCLVSFPEQRLGIKPKKNLNTTKRRYKRTYFASLTELFCHFSFNFLIKISSSLLYLTFRGTCNIRLLSYFFVKKYLLVGASGMLWAVQ